jgi:hypothetical protein
MDATRIANLKLARYTTRVVCAFALVGLSTPAFAQMAFGSGLLNWAGTNIVLPLGIISVVVALGASIIRPDLVRTAIYTAIICAVIFFVIRSMGAVVTALQS